MPLATGPGGNCSAGARTLSTYCSPVGQPTPWCGTSALRLLSNTLSSMGRGGVAQLRQRVGSPRHDVEPSGLGAPAAKENEEAGMSEAEAGIRKSLETMRQAATTRSRAELREIERQVATVIRLAQSVEVTREGDRLLASAAEIYANRDNRHEVVLA